MTTEQTTDHKPLPDGYQPHQSSVRGHVLKLMAEHPDSRVTLKWLTTKIRQRKHDKKIPERLVQQTMAFLVRHSEILAPGLLVVSSGQVWHTPPEPGAATSGETHIDIPEQAQVALGEGMVPAVTPPTFTLVRETSNGALILAAPDGRWGLWKEI